MTHSQHPGETREDTWTIKRSLFSWEKPIETELLQWARTMKRSNLTYIATTIWGRKQKREAEIYANAFRMVEEEILREIKIREPSQSLNPDRKDSKGEEK